MAKTTLSQQYFYSLYTVMKAAHLQSQQSQISDRKKEPSTRSKKQVVTTTVSQQHSHNTLKSQTPVIHTIHNRIHNLKVTQEHPNTLSQQHCRTAHSHKQTPSHIRGTHTITLSHRHFPSQLSTRSQTHCHSSITTPAQSQLTLTQTLTHKTTVAHVHSPHQ